MPRSTTIESLADLAEDQWGLFTRRQAEATGMAWTTLARFAKDGAAERVAHGVYRMRGTPADEHLELRAAWLQLAPDTMVWERKPEQGVVSHRSAATIYGLGHLPADIHQFTFPMRRQTRRADVRLFLADLGADDWIRLGGLLVTRPSRIAADLLGDREDPQAVGHVIVDALREVKDGPANVARAIAPHATMFGLSNQDGVGMLKWLLGLVDDPKSGIWLAEAESSVAETKKVSRRGNSK